MVRVRVTYGVRVSRLRFRVRPSRVMARVRVRYGVWVSRFRVSRVMISMVMPKVSSLG